jgi:hypothetical protein
MRKTLRHWLGLPPQPNRQFEPLELTIGRALARVHRIFAQTKEARSHDYLQQVRGIPSGILTSPRFIGTVRDWRGRACFPRADENAMVTGMELRGCDYKGYSPGGWKQCTEAMYLRTR